MRLSDDGDFALNSFIQTSTSICNLALYGGFGQIYCITLLPQTKWNPLMHEIRIEQLISK